MLNYLIKYNMETNSANNLSILISTFATIQAAYPTHAITLDLGLNHNDEQTHLWDAPDGKLYLWAMENNGGITFLPTDTDEIEDAGICTRELTTPEGLTIIIAEDF